MENRTLRCFKISSHVVAKVPSEDKFKNLSLECFQPRVDCTGVNYFYCQSFLGACVGFVKNVKGEKKVFSQNFKLYFRYRYL